MKSQCCPRPQEIKTKKRASVCQEKKKKGKANVVVENNWVHFCPSNKSNSLFKYFLNFGEKTPESYHLFSFFPHLTKYTLKKFSFLFSLQNFPFSPYFTLFHPKQTHPKGFAKPNNPVFPYIVGVHEEPQSSSLFNN